MVTKEDIERLLNSHINRLLLVVEAALPPSQFQALRKFTLDEFGNNGLGKELERLLREKHKVR
jgi:hypothetical protein